MTVKELHGSGRMTKEESINIKDITDYRCKECKKDWTKCSKCPVMMKWVKEIKPRFDRRYIWSSEEK